MADATAEAADQVPNSGRRRLRMMALALGLAGAGLAAGYLGVVSPRAALFSADPGIAAPPIRFVDVPRLLVPLAGSGRSLMITVKLDVDPAQAGLVETMLPRVTDSFNAFLSDIDPAAFSRRGALEIVRNELATRVDMIFGAGAVHAVLITEFAIE